ncbi:MAG: hypothetical protein NWQ79_05190, partial [Ilumatobacteraceae bacterium]|nr:hypothetical protein [Ilumatobacteraceae bacterium]
MAGVAAIAIKHPELAQELTATWDMLSEPRKQRDALRFAQVHTLLEAGDTDAAAGLIKEQVEGLRNAGDDEGADLAEAVLE